LQRARHNPFRLAPPRRREFVLLRTPLRTVFVPITHDLVHAATVHTAGQAAHVLYPVTKERGACPHFQVIDVAVQGLVHSEDELRHVLTPPHKFPAVCNWPSAASDASTTFTISPISQGPGS